MGAPQTVNGKFTAVSLSDKAKDGVSTRGCATHCKKENFRYFGMMYGGACRCSNSYGSKGEDPNGCTMDCFQGTDNAFLTSSFEHGLLRLTPRVSEQIHNSPLI